MPADDAAVTERLRLFVAVAVPDDVRTAVADAVRPLRERWPELAWVAPRRWHLTVAFLGGVDADRRPAVDEALRAGAALARPFEAALDVVAGTFGRRVLWVAVDGGEMLPQLVLAMRGALTSRGFGVEDGPFRPHLTLARARRKDRLPAGIAAAYAGPACSWRVDRVTLYHSQTRPAGAVYTEMATAILG